MVWKSFEFVVASPLLGSSKPTFRITLYILSDCVLVKILLFGDQNYTQVENACIINATIKYLVDSERFSGPLL